MNNLLDVMETTEERVALAFCIELPMPPTDNHCHQSLRSGMRIPTREYTDWLRIAAPMLKKALGDQVPDPVRWWTVDLRLWLPGTRADGQNYEKPLIDILSGAQMEKYVTKAGNRSEHIVKPGGLWTDDKRIRFKYTSIEAFNCGERAKARIECTPVPAPDKWTKERVPRKKVANG